jgi:hypothetical protein
MSAFVNPFTQAWRSCQLPFYQRGFVLVEFEGTKMSLNSNRLSLLDVRFKIFTEMAADLEAQFLELLWLRERLRQAELSADLQSKTRARTPAPVVSAAVA